MTELIPHRQSPLELIGIAKWDHTGIETKYPLQLPEIIHNLQVMETVESASQWGAADLVIMAEEIDPENGLAMVEQYTGYSISTLRKFRWTRKTFPKHRQHKALSFSHHETVATGHLAPNQQDRLLEAAAQQGWSVRELRDEKQNMMQIGPGEERDTRVWNIEDLLNTIEHLLQKVEPAENENQQLYYQSVRDMLAFFREKYLIK